MIGLTGISDQGLLRSNAPDCVVELPGLSITGEQWFTEVESVDIETLYNVTDDLIFANSSLPSITAPNLVTIVGDFNITNCSSLTSLSFPKLQSIGGNFLMGGDSQLLNLTGFPALTTVGGSIDWAGVFDIASLPQINTVDGGINVQSSSNTFKCPFPQLRTNGAVKGSGARKRWRR